MEEGHYRRKHHTRLICVRFLLFAALAFALGAPCAATAGYPSRPIHLILPYAPGGIIEFVGRTLSQTLGEVLHEPVVVEGRPGAGGIVGVNYTAHAAPDGYTIVLVDPAIVTNPSLHKSLPYDIFKDLVPISIVATAPEVLVVAPQLGIKTQEALVAYGKANPGKLDYASAGVGSTPHLAAELWKSRTGIQVTHIPYGGIGPAFIDLMSGKVQMSFSSLPAAMPFIAKGSLVALATTGLKRSPMYPDLPTVSELLPGYEVDLWLGIYGSARMPPDVLATLNGGVDKALQDGALKTAFAKFGIAPRGTTVQEGAAFTKAEYEKWRKVILGAHITLD
ncbi:MAG TPA: tripartite tricarboxylate transporter substrate binding protein [Xanthobacteraceae bacterium]